ncbi:MAG: hypothetical protein II080_08830, partial [Lachnospiraceae bacterium]|nr:hypothetical protein [Lachnospiraceae bacterium]
MEKSGRKTEKCGKTLTLHLVLSLILGIGYSGKVGFVPVCALLETCKYIRKNLPVHWQREGFEQEISS